MDAGSGGSRNYDIAGPARPSSTRFLISRSPTTKFPKPKSFPAGRVCAGMAHAPAGRLTLWEALCLVLSCAVALMLRVVSLWRYGPLLRGYESFWNARMTKRIADLGPRALQERDPLSWPPRGFTAAEAPPLGLSALAAAGTPLASLWGDGSPGLESACLWVVPVSVASAVILSFLLARRLSDRSTAFMGPICALLVAAAPGYAYTSQPGDFSQDCVFAVPSTLACALLWLRAIGAQGVMEKLLGGALTGALCAVVAGGWEGYPMLLWIIAIHTAWVEAVGRDTTAREALYGVAIAFVVIFYALGLHHVYVRPDDAGALLSPLIISLALPVLRGSGAGTVRHDHPRGAARSALSMTLFAGAASIAMWLLASCTTTAPDFESRPAHPIVRVLAMPARRMARAVWGVDVDSNATRIRLSNIISQTTADASPATWARLYRDMHMLLFAAPAGLCALVQRGGVSASFMLIWAFIACVLLAAGQIRLLSLATAPLCVAASLPLARLARAGAGMKRRRRAAVAAACGCACVGMLGWFLLNSANESLSRADAAPAHLLVAPVSGGVVQYNDIRQGFAWARGRIPLGSRIAAWTDHGHLITALGGAIAMVDSSAYNVTRVGRVAAAFAAPEPEAHAMLRRMGADYVFVVFGGLCGFASDDLAKMSAMLRVAAESTAASPRPIRPQDFKTGLGRLRVSSRGSPLLHRSLLYRLSYHRFGDVHSKSGAPQGFDRVRNEEIAVKNVTLSHFEEVYTSPRWLFRLYKLSP